MKFMGSKRSMLANGLGATIAAELRDNTSRFVDLFCGSGAVAWYVAVNWKVEVLASDIQSFSVALADAVVSRDATPEIACDQWLRTAVLLAKSNSCYREALAIQRRLPRLGLAELEVITQNLCSSAESGPLLKAYGGYYFSPLQALILDALRASLPAEPRARATALAATIEAASICCAAPGHTAQPFKFNESAGPFLLKAWSRNVAMIAGGAFDRIGRLKAKFPGRAVVCDATTLASSLREGDLAFIDPPYSSVQYSRFYHVLESVASGDPATVSGIGRYPPLNERPQSDFSKKTKSKEALCSLLRLLSEVGARAIITFPAALASGGLSGKIVQEVASEYFDIEQSTVVSRFSTLGGNSVIRAARKDSEELILTLSPRWGKSRRLKEAIVRSTVLRSTAPNAAPVLSGT